MDTRPVIITHTGVRPYIILIPNITRNPVVIAKIYFFIEKSYPYREFGETLQEAKKAGVHILAYDCLVEPDRMEIQDPVPVCLASDWK